MKFAEVIIPLDLQDTFTYHIPSDLDKDISVGKRVVVSFGGRKLYTGIVESIHEQAPKLYKTKPILSVLDDYSMVTSEQLSLWKWVAEYYVCSLGEVYRNMMPSALKLESETYIRKGEIELGDMVLTQEELYILESLENKTSISLKEMEAFIPKPKLISSVKSLYELGLIMLDEQVVEKYKPKVVSYIRISKKFENKDKFKEALETLYRAEKQRELFLKFIQIEKNRSSAIEKRELVELSSSAIVKALVDKGYLEEYYLNKDRVEEYDDDIEDLYKLSEAQNIALVQIQKGFEEKNTVLLYGVTASGKTEIYFHLIEEILSKDKGNALLLLPEISITTQILNRIQKKFGAEVGVYHSKMNQSERVETWNNILNNKYRVVVGVRSAIFLPLKEVELIIVDEEQAASYKQSDVQPLYNARDCVQVLASLHKAKVLLGSATPSLESMYNSEQGKYTKVELLEKLHKEDIEVEVVDMKKHIQPTNISNRLKEEILAVLEKKRQVVIFHNRRGFSPVIECTSCGYTPLCPNCDIALTYHKVGHSLKCHYCSYRQAVPISCPVCNSTKLDSKGLGTQQIEEELNVLFPEANIARMDSDTMRRKHAYEILFEKMKEGSIDILVGTQMVTKGLDFENVELVGVIKGDSLFNKVSFRAEERAVQLLMQVSGRSGRKGAGKVLIQAYNTDNVFFKYIKTQDYSSALPILLRERELFTYPPYCRMIDITFKHLKSEVVLKYANMLKELLIESNIPQNLILGPAERVIPRLNNRYIYTISIKYPSNKSMKGVKGALKLSMSELEKIVRFKSVKIIVDVDPN